MMTQNYWKTGASTAAKKEVRWPSAGQAVRQLVVAGVIGLIWGGLFWAYLLAGADPAPAVAVVEPTATATPSPEPTATSTPPATATSTPPATTSAAAAATPTSPPTATPLPEPAATSTPAPEPPPTDTPVPVDSAPAAGAGVSFAQDVLPIFKNRCLKCHGGEKTEEGLALTDYQDVLAGSWNGKVIEPGNVPNSFLIEQIVSGDMPKKEPRLLPAEIRIITAWVEAGAPNN